jgi:hypothetical protein
VRRCWRVAGPPRAIRRVMVAIAAQRIIRRGPVGADTRPRASSPVGAGRGQQPRARHQIRLVAPDRHGAEVVGSSHLPGAFRAGERLASRTTSSCSGGTWPFRHAAPAPLQRCIRA